MLICRSATELRTSSRWPLRSLSFKLNDVRQSEPEFYFQFSSGSRLPSLLDRFSTKEEEWKRLHNGFQLVFLSFGRSC